MSIVESTTGTLLDKVLAGGPESVTAIMCFIVMGLIFALIAVVKWAKEKDREVKELNSRALEQLQDINDKLLETMTEINDKHSNDINQTVQSLNSLQIALTEVRTVVAILGGQATRS